jgi:hypothetical protein
MQNGTSLEDTIRNYASNGVPDRDICEILDLHPDDLEARFGKTLIKARAERRAKLYELQTKAAEDGTVSLLTHLGKHELGQNAKAAVVKPILRNRPEPRLDYKMG